MKFRDDIDPANTYVISDTHFGHDNIVGFCFRPEDHEQVMIAQWRKVVPDDATVIHVGDVAYSGNGRFRHIVSKELTGARKLLILGNHDRQRYSFYKQSGFSICRPFAIKYPEHRTSELATEYDVSFSHYPWDDEEEGRKMRYTDVRIHGHIHNNGYTRDGFVPFLKRHINVSVEQLRYTPVNLKLLLDAYLFGEYPETTDEQLAEARARAAEARAK